MTSRKHATLLFHLWTAMLANALFLLCLIGIKNLPPMEDIKISAQNDGLILSGKTIWGLNQINTFQNWDELTVYLKEKDIDLIPASDANLGGHHQARLTTESNIRLYRDQREESIALQLPDLKSAQVFQENLRFGNLVNGPFGFSLRAENKLYQKIKSILNPG